MDAMTRSELAKKCGVNIETLRYYEKRKLLGPPPRSKSGYRLYSEEDAVKIRFIKNAQKLGFTLREIGDLLKLRVRQDAPSESVLIRVQNKLEEIEKKIHDLRSMKKTLQILAGRCQSEGPTRACPILASFESNRGV